MSVNFRSTKSGSRGSTLATTLVIGFLALVLGLALASSSVSQLHFTNNEIRNHQARAAAEAVCALATERVVESETFGSANEMLEVPTENGLGRLTFDPAQAATWGIPPSVSNRTGAAPITGWNGSSVPPGGVQLVAVGETSGRRKIVEAILQVPDFPYALASSGPVVSDGGLLIGGVEAVEDAFNGLQADQLEPADLASNANGEAIKLDGLADIAGNLKAVGNIVLGTDVNVHGELEQGADPVPIAQIDVTALRPDGSVAFVNSPSPMISDSVHYNQPNLTITGGLTLDQGILYVNGDLTVRGGVRGEGALLVNGDVTIYDGAALAADSQLALVAEGNVNIHGGNKQTSFFQGLIYTEGDLFAEDVTLLGAFVANREKSAVDPGSRLTMNNASAVHLGRNASFKTKANKVGLTIRTPGEGGSTYNFNLNVSPAQLNQILETGRANHATVGDHTHANHLRPLVAMLENAGISGDSINGNTDNRVSSAELAANLLSGNQGRVTSSGGGSTTVNIQGPVFQFDLNEFLSAASRIKVLSWTEY